ncbi:MAG: hypothetical protein ACXWSD_21120 [Bdellovibrionota bacterium]
MEIFSQSASAYEANSAAECACSKGGFPTKFFLQSSWVCYDADRDVAYPCEPPTTNSNPDTNTSTSTAVENFVSSVKTSIETNSIKGVANAANGQQTSSLGDAAEVAALGANKAATIGATFCAQGANANLTSAADAAVYYSHCQQNFDAAKGLSGKPGGFIADQGVLDGSAAQQSLQDFEKNFGVSKEDYLKRMLGEGGGLGALSGMVDGKIADAKLAEAMDAAGKLGPSDLTQDPNKFAVNLGVSGSKKSAAALRDVLKKKLGEKSEGRATASLDEVSHAEKPQLIGDKEHLDPLSMEVAFGSKEESRELTIFDVVHIRYSKLAARMHR